MCSSPEKIGTSESPCHYTNLYGLRTPHDLPEVALYLENRYDLDMRRQENRYSGDIMNKDRSHTKLE